MKKTFRQKGFTLIELLVVIVILGILSTISVGTFRAYFAKARDSERVSAVQNLAMMIKVGTGGDGTCGVYNVLKLSADTPTDCKDDAYELDELIAENDYKMPNAKSGLSYYYGFKKGDKTGDNEFFIVIGAEEEDPQNGSAIQDTSGDTATFLFIDGTRGGLDALLGEDSTVPACTWVSSAPGSCMGWIIHPIKADGTLDTVVS